MSVWSDRFLCLSGSRRVRSGTPKTPGIIGRAVKGTRFYIRAERCKDATSTSLQAVKMGKKVHEPSLARHTAPSSPVLGVNRSVTRRRLDESIHSSVACTAVSREGPVPFGHIPPALLAPLMLSPRALLPALKTNGSRPSLGEPLGGPSGYGYGLPSVSLRWTSSPPKGSLR